MNVRLLHQIPPAPDNPRNSEGAFLRGKQGEILFAYSRYHGESCHDHAASGTLLVPVTVALCAAVILPLRSAGIGMIMYAAAALGSGIRGGLRRRLLCRLSCGGSALVVVVKIVVIHIFSICSLKRQIPMVTL